MKKGQVLCCDVFERIDSLILKRSFRDQNNEVFFSYFYEIPDEIDTLTKGIGSKIVFFITNHIFIDYSACERHDDKLGLHFINFIKKK